jgi:hypothetical protein
MIADTSTTYNVALMQRTDIITLFSALETPTLHNVSSAADVHKAFGADARPPGIASTSSAVLPTITPEEEVVACLVADG